MRYWLRHYSKYPTYPQLFINGDLIGGVDKTKEALEKGILKKLISDESKINMPDKRFKEII